MQGERNRHTGITLGRSEGKILRGKNGTGLVVGSSTRNLFGGDGEAIRRFNLRYFAGIEKERRKPTAIAKKTT